MLCELHLHPQYIDQVKTSLAGGLVVESDYLACLPSPAVLDHNYQLLTHQGECYKVITFHNDDWVFIFLVFMFKSLFFILKLIATFFTRLFLILPSLPDPP